MSSGFVAGGKDLILIAPPGPGKTLKDNSLAQGLIDRLIHHGEGYYLEGDSYRLKGEQDILNSEDLQNQTQNDIKVSTGEEKGAESRED